MPLDELMPDALTPDFMDERRTLRVSETVREELAELIGFEMDDPRLAAVNVAEVQVSPDAHYASIRVAVNGAEREQNQAIAALEHARHYLRQRTGGPVEPPACP